MSSEEDEGDQPEKPVGYRKPPSASRFEKGRSGNPKGRPPGRFKDAPYQAVLGQPVMIREGGQERSVTAAEAFLLKLAKRGLEGDGLAARSTMRAIESARIVRPVNSQEITTIIWQSVAPGSVTGVLETLRGAHKLDPYRPSARMVLEPWLVEAALARLGGRRLTPEEQRIVVDATRTPKRVNWPEWWTVGVGGVRLARQPQANNLKSPSVKI